MLEVSKTHFGFHVIGDTKHSISVIIFTNWINVIIELNEDEGQKNPLQNKNKALDRLTFSNDLTNYAALWWIISGARFNVETFFWFENGLNVSYSMNMMIFLCEFGSNI